MATDPYEGAPTGTIGLGRRSALATRSDTADLARVSRLRVFTPAALSSAAIKVIPVDNAGEDFVTFNLTPGVAEVLPVLVRRVYDTGTETTLVIHAV